MKKIFLLTIILFSFLLVGCSEKKEDIYLNHINQMTEDILDDYIINSYGYIDHYIASSIVLLEENEIDIDVESLIGNKYEEMKDKYLNMEFDNVGNAFKAISAYELFDLDTTKIKTYLNTITTMEQIGEYDKSSYLNAINQLNMEKTDLYQEVVEFLNLPGDYEWGPDSVAMDLQALSESNADLTVIKNELFPLLTVDGVEQSFDGQSIAATTSTLLMGLYSVENYKNEKFTIENQSLIDIILKYKSDEGFLNNNEVDAYATPQGFAALVTHYVAAKTDNVVNIFS